MKIRKLMCDMRIFIQFPKNKNVVIQSGRVNNTAIQLPVDESTHEIDPNTKIYEAIKRKTKIRETDLLRLVISLPIGKLMTITNFERVIALISCKSCKRTIASARANLHNNGKLSSLVPALPTGKGLVSRLV